MSQRNSALAYFEEACSYQRAIYALRLRAETYSNLPPEQAEQRKMILLIACKLLEDEINQLIPLGITTWASQESTTPDAKL